MSVLIPDLKVYNYIRNGLDIAANRSVCDEYYSYSMHVNFKNKDIEKEVRRLIVSWLNMNEKSYDLKYNEKPESKQLSFFLKYTYQNITALQLLKFIQCVIYNIELEHWQPSEQETKDYELLKKWEFELALGIIGQMDEYKNAGWSDLTRYKNAV